MIALRWILLAPVIGAILNGLILRNKSAKVSGIVGTLASLSAFAFALINVLGEHGGWLLDPWFDWIVVGSTRIPFHLEVTPVTSIMLMVITGIGTLIHLYSVSYISHDDSPWRFFAYLNLFLAAMLTLVMSSNLVGVFLGWEGVGLCSYLLIGYWYKHLPNADAGMKAFVTNRIGDLGFFFALMVLLATIGTTEIREILKFVQDGALSPWILMLVAGGLFWASTGKSAQVPLYVWLPDAMAGPTPVSALIHAATMVTSGVVVTTRLWPLFAGAPEVLEFMFWGGMATAWLGALIAVSQNDIKKVMAYSTVSQLGFMFVALGAGSPTAALFHVVTHACFKALLFLGSGSVIHGMHEDQDMMNMGGLRHHMPATHWTFLAGTLAIIGFPFTSGFFSKDMILAKVFESAGWTGYLGLLGAAVLTAFYMFRAFTLTFWGEARSDKAKHAHESDKLMLIPLAVLAVGSLFVGWLETPVVIGGIHQFETWVSSSWYGVEPMALGHHHLSHAMEWTLMGITTALSLGSAYLAFKRFQNPAKIRWTSNAFIRASEKKFCVDEIYNALVLKPLSCLANLLTKWVDIRGINGFLHGLRDFSKNGGAVLALFHTGNVQTYAWYIAMGAALMMGMAVLWLI
ncbi:MAG TPA: NADH-quinone oxidoreductase subunit L [Bdellovibrionota bacterium]|jgi:NADH-quinone oxidoreductase subunit L|nr:NADH-quinone oxidoreductase subunit L [Bdellovibrionota bacterium]